MLSDHMHMLFTQDPASPALAKSFHLCRVFDFYGSTLLMHHVAKCVRDPLYSSTDF